MPNAELTTRHSGIVIPHSEFRIPHSVLARLGRFERPTHGSGGRCSIRAELQAHIHPVVGVIPKRPHNNWSGREDLNLRLPAPKAGALPGCATPRNVWGTPVSKPRM